MSKHHIRLHARRWSIVRKAVLERDGYRFTECGQAGRLEVDHITPLQREPGQNPYDVNGLQALCRDCHIEKTRRVTVGRSRLRKRSGMPLCKKSQRGPQ